MEDNSGWNGLATRFIWRRANSGLGLIVPAEASKRRIGSTHTVENLIALFVVPSTVTPTTPWHQSCLLNTSMWSALGSWGRPAYKVRHLGSRPCTFLFLKTPSPFSLNLSFCPFWQMTVDDDDEYSSWWFINEQLKRKTDFSFVLFHVHK